MEVITIKDLLINDSIIVANCRLVGENNEQLGIMDIEEARKIAEEAELDLVLISPSAVPPVCKIMDYGKFKFDQAKKQKEVRKKQKVLEMKTIQLSMNISEHDVEYRSTQAKEFLSSGAKVKLSIMMKGRQAVYASRGIDVCNNFYQRLSEECIVEKSATVENKYITMILAPKPSKDKK